MGSRRLYRLWSRLSTPYGRFTRLGTTTTMTDARDWKSNGGTPGRSPHSNRRNDGGADPTDPEVPDAKRRRAMRRRSSWVVAALAVTGLLVVALLLLYRMGKQVTSAGSHRNGGEVTAPAAALSVAPAPGSFTAPEVPALRESAAPRASAAGSISGPPPRAKPPTAPDIIRKPAF